MHSCSTWRSLCTVLINNESRVEHVGEGSLETRCPSTAKKIPASLILQNPQKRAAVFEAAHLTLHLSGVEIPSSFLDLGVTISPEYILQVPHPLSRHFPYFPQYACLGRIEGLQVYLARSLVSRGAALAQALLIADRLAAPLELTAAAMESVTNNK